MGGFIDAWGSGTLRIIEECKQANLPEPALEERNGRFVKQETASLGNLLLNYLNVLLYLYQR
jgi:predicted HTH transcriptional regulator